MTPPQQPAATEAPHDAPSPDPGAVATPDRSARDLLAWLALVLAGLPLTFYVGGTLLTLGFFFSLGLTPLTAFSPTDLALAGWLRVAGSTFLVVPVVAIAGVVAWPVSSAIADRIMMQRPQLATVILSALVATGCIAATVRAGGVLQGLLSAVAATMFIVFALAFATKRERALQDRARSSRWLLLMAFVALAFAALGEVGFVEAMSARHPASMRAMTPDGAACVRPLLLGADRLIYERRGGFFLSDHDGKSVLKIGGRERSPGKADRPELC